MVKQKKRLPSSHPDRPRAGQPHPPAEHEKLEPSGFAGVLPLAHPKKRVWLLLGFGAALALLLAHAFLYRFQTDDGFISFRYARNLAHGFGLVFNPGHERVEGYSNFLWVLVLALLDRAGIAPETAANPLGFSLTLVLGALVVWFASRRRVPPGAEWVVLVPSLLLAVTRSVAVWATGGLETRLFEVLVVAGALRLVVELEGERSRAPRRPLAVWLFALAALTRPDGLLFAVCAYATSALLLIRWGRFDARRFALGLLPFVVLVGGHFIFRRIYYGDWLPNTYYAKVGGRLRWAPGFSYLAAFALEYGAYLWIPALWAAVLLHRDRGSAYLPLLLAALVVPHALYVAAVGGDHFEYRPLDVYFPFVFLLVGDGLARWAGTRRGAAIAAACLGLVIAGLVELPLQSHLQFTRRYVTGFPGYAAGDREASLFLDPSRDPVYRWPGPRAVALAHRALLDSLTRHYVGLRQEEHRLFLEIVIPEGRRLRQLVERGLLPADTHLAISSVGAIPYYSDLRVLDRLGLTDRTVAHMAFAGTGLLAHEKLAAPEYAIAANVDLWAIDPVHSLWSAGDPDLLPRLRFAVSQGYPVQAADVGGGTFLVGWLPGGEERARARFPRLRFRSPLDPAFVSDVAGQAAIAYRESLRVHPGDLETRSMLASMLMLTDRIVEARREWEEVVRADPSRARAWAALSRCREWTGDLPGAIETARRALELARAKGDSALTAELESQLASYPATERSSNRRR